MPASCAGDNIQLRQIVQIAFHIPVMHSIFQCDILAAVQDISPSDRAKPLFGLITFFLVKQMPVLCRDLFATVLDLENLAAVFLLVIDHHVKLADRKLQLEHPVFSVSRLHGFQQDNILQHPYPVLLRGSCPQPGSSPIR